jgi:hypothetical protein
VIKTKQAKHHAPAIKRTTKLLSFAVIAPLDALPVAILTKY